MFRCVISRQVIDNCCIVPFFLYFGSVSVLLVRSFPSSLFLVRFDLFDMYRIVVLQKIVVCLVGFSSFENSLFSFFDREFIDASFLIPRGFFPNWYFFFLSDSLSQFSRGV